MVKECKMDVCTSAPKKCYMHAPPHTFSAPDCTKIATPAYTHTNSFLPVNNILWLEPTKILFLTLGFSLSQFLYRKCLGSCKVLDIRKIQTSASSESIICHINLNFLCLEHHHIFCYCRFWRL